MSRFNQILIVVLVLQLALTAFVVWPESAGPTGGGPLLADFSAAGVSKLVVKDGDGNQVSLAKENGQWVLAGTDSFPADDQKVTSLLDKLEGVKSNRLVTKTEASHKRLQVAGDGFNRLLEITLPNGSIQKVYIGSSAGAGATHIRLADRPEVYLTNQVAGYDVNAQPAGWIDTQYYTIPQTATVALTLQNQNGVFEFTKDGDAWALQDLAEGETLKTDAVTTLLNQASSVRMSAPLGKTEKPEYGLDEPTAVVTLKIDDGTQTQVKTLTIGAQDEAHANSYIVKYSESPYYVRVTDFVGNQFVEKTRDDFLEAPPAGEDNNTAATPEAGAPDSGASN